MVAIPELDLTIKLLDGWTRFWWKGKLLPITLELQAKVVRGEQENAVLRRENAEQTRQLTEQARAITDKDHQLTEQSRAITNQAQVIAEMQAEMERMRKSAG